MTRTKPNDNDLYTPKTLAQMWGCSERHVRQIIRRGDLEHFKVGATLIRIPGEAVDDYQRRMTVPAKEPAAAGNGIDAPSRALQRARLDAMRRAAPGK